jgi:hypothetical protein
LQAAARASARAVVIPVDVPPISLLSSVAQGQPDDRRTNVEGRQTYVLVWTTGDTRGAYCPSGGLGPTEGEEAVERLYALARAAGLRPVREEFRPGDKRTTIGAALVPYHFDMADAFPEAERGD